MTEGQRTRENERLSLLRKGATIYLVSIALAMTLCAVALAVAYWPVYEFDQAVKNYSGDGSIETTSRSFLGPGYRVSVDSFPIDAPWDRTYDLTSLPDVGHPVRIGLHFDEVSDRVYSIRGGRLSVRITAGDRELLSVDELIDDWNFSERIGILVTYNNFATQRSSRFELPDTDPAAPLAMHLAYWPATHAASNLSAQIELQSGGRD